MKIELAIGGYCLAAAVAGCSSSSSGAAGNGTDASPDATTVGEGGVAPDATPDGTKGGDGGAGGTSVSGVVADFSTSDATKNFDATQYPPLSGAQVCVNGNASVPCVTTDASGKYTLTGLPTGKALYLSYTKTGFRSTLYGVTPTAGQNTAAPPIFLDNTAAANTWVSEGDASVAPTRGGILFGALMAGPSTSPVHEVFGGTEYFYVQGFKVTISPAATAGPVYTSAGWKSDPSLTSSSTSGWGFFEAAPGDYTLTFTHPTMTCGTTTTTVVAGYDTTYVGTICTAPSADGGAAEAGTDAGTALCCNKLTDNTTGCSGGAMVNDECTCLPVPAGTDCTAALPDAGPIVTTCSGYSCCFTFDGGSCQCISPGDLASCYGAGAACSTAASANGATLANSCP